MQFAHNGSYKGSIPFGLIFIIVIINLANIIIKEYNKLIYIASPTGSMLGEAQGKGTWSSLVYGARLENEYFNKVVSSNLTVPV